MDYNGDSVTVKKIIDGPYGKAVVFTGPRVCMMKYQIVYMKVIVLL